MNRTHDTNLTADRLRRRASLTVSLVIPILTIAWLASAGVARVLPEPRIPARRDQTPAVPRRPCMRELRPRAHRRPTLRT